jgi:hypothetical protein
MRTCLALGATLLLVACSGSSTGSSSTAGSGSTTAGATGSTAASTSTTGGTGSTGSAAHCQGACDYLCNHCGVCPANCPSFCASNWTDAEAACAALASSCPAANTCLTPGSSTTSGGTGGITTTSGGNGGTGAGCTANTGAPCTADADCCDRYTYCIPSTHTCLVPHGGPCTQNSQCEGGVCTSNGVCQ